MNKKIMKNINFFDWWNEDFTRSVALFTLPFFTFKNFLEIFNFPKVAIYLLAIGLAIGIELLIYKWDIRLRTKSKRLHKTAIYIFFVILLAISSILSEYFTFPKI